ncbi:conserved hypothetical protein [Trichinella spiralis]|uniref:hypothetical protein n=1 Tax=Trichinella spiralis TaxID=6334 RepID=UPI0001EFE041|nr:conserved hypothetical protein [Trichinella spiralis]
MLLCTGESCCAPFNKGFKFGVARARRRRHWRANQKVRRRSRDRLRGDLRPRGRVCRRLCTLPTSAGNLQFWPQQFPPGGVGFLLLVQPTYLKPKQQFHLVPMFI